MSVPCQGEKRPVTVVTAEEPGSDIAVMGR